MSLQQVIRFTTDIVGLERTLRFWHALLLLVTNSPTLLTAVVAGVRPLRHADFKASLALAQCEHVLVGLLAQVGIVRRYFRLFRVVESFYEAQRLFGELLVPDEEAKANKDTKDGQDAQVRHRTHAKGIAATLPPWLDAFTATFFGMHLLLEVLTLPDVLGIDGLVAWGPAATVRLTIESLRFWFLALSCSVGAGVLRLLRVARDVPMPPMHVAAMPDGTTEVPLAVLDSDLSGLDPAILVLDIQREQARLRRISRASAIQRRAWQRGVQARAIWLGRHILADGLDLVIPGSVIGWLPARPTTVATAMLVTTVLTGWDAWERCGVEKR